MTPRESVLLQERVNADEVLLAAIQRHRGGESLEALCLRFARARPKSVEKALAMLTADMQWRDSYVDGLASETAAEVLGGADALAQYLSLIHI